MNIVVLGGGYTNKGNEAMLRVVQREIARRVPNANIFAALAPSEHVLASSSGITPVGIGHAGLEKRFGSALACRASVSKHLMRTGSLIRLARSLVSPESTRHELFPEMLDRKIGGIDAVIDIHGYAFGDPWGLGGFRAAAEWGRFCSRKRKPYFFLQQTWGPFGKKGYAEAVAEVLENATCFYARETLSQAELANALGSPIEKIPLAPDTVLRFESGPLAKGESILQRMGLKRCGRPLIGITPNMRVYERTAGKGTGNDYIRILTRLCDWFSLSLDADLVLIPNQISPVTDRLPMSKTGKPHVDDRFLCGLIASGVKEPSRCFAVREYLSAEEVHSAIGCLDLLIGSRFHTLVFALSLGIPLVAIGWAHKYDGLLQQFGLGDYFVDCRNMGEEIVCGLVARAWEQRGQSAAKIRSVLPQIQSEVDAVFDRIAGEMKKR